MVDSDEVIKIVKSFVRKNARFVDFYGDMDDFEQEMMLYVFTNLHKFDETRGKLSSWIYKLCSNKAKYVYKITKNKIRLNKCRSLSELMPGSCDTTLADIIEDTNYDLEDEIDRIYTIHKLSPYMSNELYLRYIKDMSVKELAELNNISKQAMSLRIAKNLEKLKEMMKSE